MLHTSKIIAFVATRDFETARAFYGGKLALPLVAEDGHALVFDAAGTMLRVTRVRELPPAPFTVLGWEVSDIEATARSIEAAGIPLLRVPGLPQDDLGIWTTPDGTRVAWFKDPDGNTLSISRH